MTLNSETGEFRRHPRAEERKRSAVALVKLLLSGAGLIDDHRREFLKLALWKVTQAEPVHKHRTRFCSEAALSAPRNKLRHDHVYQRAIMVDKLLAAPEETDAILSPAVACTITEDEHRRLSQFKHLDGWDRNAAAGIIVIDTAHTFPPGEPAA